jgi:hypothetical protein
MPFQPIQLAILALALGASASADGQDAQPIEQGKADINPLQTSLRALPQVMRHDTAFEHVYQSPIDSEQRYRVAGGVYAVFDASQYVQTQYGLVPVYPAGVQFHIGTPLGFVGNPVNDPATAALLRVTDPRFAPGLDLSAADRQGAGVQSVEVQTLDRHLRGPAPVAMADPTISSEPVRQRRLRELTARAIREANAGG